MVPSETQFKAEEMRPTGIRLPPGLPVRIVASGGIKREATPGLLTFCEKVAPFCENSEEVKAMLNNSLPPWGDETWYGDRRGFSQLWWDGPGDAEGNTVVFPQDQPVIRRPWPGGELWAGHSYWECYWVYTEPDYTQVQGDCFNMSGSWSIAVVPDDGSETDPKTGQPIAGSAALTATLTSSLDASGFHLTGHAKSAGGTPLAEERWIYVADAPAAPPMVSSRQEAGPRAARSAAPADSLHKSESMLPRISTAPLLAPPHTDLGSPSRAARAQASEAAEQFIASCDDQSECVADVGTSPGKLVVQAVISGVTYSAYATVPGSNQLTVECQSAHGTNTAVRGEALSCAVGNPKHVIKGWSFQPDSPELPSVIESENFDKTWAGPVAVSGTITVHGWTVVADAFQTPPAEATAHIGVIARDWGAIPTTFAGEPEFGGQGDISEIPVAIPGLAGLHIVLGKFAPQFPTSLPARVHTDGGPNAGYYWLQDAFRLLRPKVYINHALDNIGRWAEQQRVDHPGLIADSKLPWCTTAAFPSVKAEAQRHEGLGGALNSHYGIALTALLASNLTAHYESLVLATDDGSVWADSVSKPLDRFFEKTKPKQVAFDAAEYPLVTQWAGNCEFFWQP